MTIEEIRKNAPDRATHYNLVEDVVFYIKRTDCFRKRVKQYFYMDGKWIPCQASNPKPL